MKPIAPLYFVHISDTHIGPSPDSEIHNKNTFANVEKVVDIINNMAMLPDFVIHTGDVVNAPDPQAYQLASDLFAKLKIPIYFVTGNHDQATDIHHYLPMGKKESLSDDKTQLFYRFEQKGYEFLVLDGRGQDEIDPQGHLSKNQLAFLHDFVHTGDKPLTIFIHFPALTMNSGWFDENMLIQNGMAFHEAIRGSNRLRGVFHGHVHQNMQTIRDGVLYAGIASTYAQFLALPETSKIYFDPQHASGYGLVHLLPDQTIIHQHTF